MALATVPDVQNALGRPLEGAEVSRTQNLLVLASSAVEIETGYRFEPGSYITGRVPRRGKVHLPGVVATVESVTAVERATGQETTVTDYVLRGSTLYNLTDCYVEVEFTITAAVPQEIVNLVAGIVAATLAGPPVGAQSAQAGPFQMSFVQSSGKVWFSATDKLILRRYKTRRAALELI